MTPYEHAMGRKANVCAKDIGVWGADCYVHQRKDQRAGAMAAKSEPGIYLGHSDDTNAATVLVLRTGKKVVTRDVKFINGSFAHMRAMRAGSDAVAAVLDGHSEPEPEYLPALGGWDPQPDVDDHDVAHQEPADASAESEQEEWTVESILQRRVRRDGVPMYKVRWAGNWADTWEPEQNVNDCKAYDEFMAAQDAPRRSPRLNEPAQLESKEDPEAALSDNDDDVLPGRVEMVMRACEASQSAHERPERHEMVNAVASGLSAIEARTPKTLSEALSGPDADKWRAARQAEYDSCIAQKVWEEVPRSALPKGTNILPYKDVFKIKLAEDGSIEKFKARFTPKGFRQKPGIDYKETFARTGMYKTERLALSLAARFDSELVQFDVPAAFLNAEVEEVVSMEMPKGFGKDGMVARLLKSLYGLKQAPRNWDRLVHEFITMKMGGWRACVSDPSLYYKRSRTGRLMLIFRFVDDMQGQREAIDAAEFKESSDMLRERFNITEMTTATWMLGMRITRDRAARTIKLDQELYITKALERYGLAQCKVVTSPEVCGADKVICAALDEPCDRQRYMEIVGTLMYAAISTRPDCSHAVHYLAGHMQTPTVRHMNAAERVLQYLAGTKEVGLVFGSRAKGVGDSRGCSEQQIDVCAFADADWANSKVDRKSISGWVAKLNGDPISWSSKKQRTVALSTCEAELYAEGEAIKEVLWLRGLLAELGLHAATGSRIYGDNQSTIAISQNGIKGERTKHVDVKYHFITETVESGAVKLQWVPTTEQQADIFTKALPAPAFAKLRAELMSK
jgi:hypothetical protein